MTLPYRAMLLLAILIFLAFPGTGKAEQCPIEPENGRPVIGLALGGGGARGFAHIGVLKYFEEQRIPFHRIAGTSMGSIAGGLTATGLDPDEIAVIVEKIDWSSMFSDGTDRQYLPARRKQDDQFGLDGPKFGVSKGKAALPSGVVAGQKILLLFENLISKRVQVNNFDHLPIPFRAIATDIVNGEMVVIEEGSLPGAMRASMSVPGAFDPAMLDDRLLVDGGLTRNLPVDIVRDMGAERVIAVNVGTPLRTADEIGSVLTIVDQMTALAIVANTEQQIKTLRPEDVLLSPRLGNDITSASFERFSDAFTLGYAAALEQADLLASFSVSEREYANWRESVERCVMGEPQIQFIRLNNQSRFSDEVIMNLVHFEPGDILDQEALDEDLRQIYGLGFIRLASYRIIEENGQNGIEIQVDEDSRGTDFLETGITLAGNGRGTFFNLRAGYLKTNLDQRGSEFRAVVQLGDEPGVFTDVYKYLDDRQQWFINPYLTAQRRDLLAYDDDGNALANIRVTDYGGGMSFGREFGRSAVLQLGVRRFGGDAKTTIGPPGLKEDFDAGEWTALAVWDRLDDLYLPTRGTRARLQYVSSEEWLGADTEFDQLLFNGLTNKTWGRHNAMLFLRYNVTLDGDAPIYGLFTGGGFLNMSGFEPNELVGPNFGVAGAGYRFEAIQSGFLPGYVGGTLEYGNAADDRSDVFSEGILNGSVYFAYDTPLGPMYLGWGWNTDTHGVLFLSLGANFGTEDLGAR